MADKEEKEGKKKSKIASLDLKNYKPKYTDSYGLGKPNEVDLDNFLTAEPENVVENKVEESIKITEPIQIEEPVKVQKPVKIEESVKVEEPIKIEKTVAVENDILDETPVQSVQSQERFHSKVIQRTKVNETSENIEKSRKKLSLREPVTVNIKHEVKERKLIEEELQTEVKEPRRRTETYGVVLSALALVYSIVVKDKAMIFLSTSLLVFLLRSTIAAPFGKYKQSVENAIRGFSMAVFIGAILFIFL